MKVIKNTKINYLDKKQRKIFIKIKLDKKILGKRKKIKLQK